MQTKAIGNLSQLSDDKLFAELEPGIELCWQNAKTILDHAQVLAANKHIRGANILQAVAEEEAAKILILFDVVRCPRRPSSQRFSDQLKRFYDHLAKGIYVEHSRARPATFGEVLRWVETETKDYYLDGPNGFDWIFYNDILCKREERMYVDYVHNDNRQQWVGPDRFEFEPLFPDKCTSAVIGIASSLCESNYHRYAALKSIASIWRVLEIDEGWSWNKLREWNLTTFATLSDNNLLAEASGQHKRTLVDEWPFPLYGCDLGKKMVKKKDLEELQLARMRVSP